MANGTDRHARARADALREQAEQFDRDMQERIEELRDADWPYDEKTSPGVIVIDTSKLTPVSAEQADAVLDGQPKPKSRFPPKRGYDRLTTRGKTAAIIGAVTGLIVAITGLLAVVIPAIVQLLTK